MATKKTPFSDKTKAAPKKKGASPPKRAAAPAKRAPAPAKRAPARTKPPAKAPVDKFSPKPRADKAPAPKPSKTRDDSTATTSRGARDTSLWIASAALDKKAIDLEIIDVTGRVDYADIIVLMTGTSDRHVASLVQGIEGELKEKYKLRPLAVEGMPHASWVLVDYGDVVVHVFQAESRTLYDVGGLWMDARRVPVPAPTRAR